MLINMDGPPENGLDGLIQVLTIAILSQPACPDSVQRREQPQKVPCMA